MSAETSNTIKLMEALAPFASLADVCDHFNKADSTPICSWRIGGDRNFGPTVGHVRAARDVLFAAGADMPVLEVQIRDIDEIIDAALRAEARLLLAHCTEVQVEKFKKSFICGIDLMDRSTLIGAIPTLQHVVTLNAKVAQAGAA